MSEAEIHGLDEPISNSISWTGSPDKYLNLESDILMSVSKTVLEPPLPETPALNSEQFKDS